MSTTITDTVPTIRVPQARVLNALLPIKPVQAKDVDIGDNKATYGIDGAKNTNDEGVPVPIPYC